MKRDLVNVTPISTPAAKSVWKCNHCAKEFRPANCSFGIAGSRPSMGHMITRFKKHACQASA